MLHVKLAYTFARSAGVRTQLDNPLFVILSAIHESGSVAQAATRLDLSYRHVWGLLKKWEETLESDLIVWERGKRARLSAFGEKLLFAEQRARMRVLPQIESDEVPIFLAYPEELLHSRRVAAFRDFVMEEVSSHRRIYRD